MSKKTRIVALVMAAIMIVAALGSVIVLPAFAAKSESQLQADIDKLEKEQKRLQAELNELSKDQKEQEKYQQTLDSQIESMEKQIDSLESQIDLYDKKIKAKETEIKNKQADIDENYELLKERLAAMQLAGENSMLSALFSAESFTDLMTRAEAIQAVAERDQALLNRLASEKRDIEAAKQELESSKKKIELNKKTLSSKKASLQSSYAKSKKHMAAIEAEKADYEKKKKEIDKQEAEAEKALQDFYNSQSSSNGTLSPGGWLWPLSAKNYYVSSKYGPRWGSFHKGVDISCSGGSANKPIVATKAGTVIKVVRTYTPMVGYGKYLIIDHGGGYSSLYAHCNDILVNTGDKVKQGQVVAKVGNTGHSYGAHVHFEIRINGQHTNPMNYITP